MSRFRLIAVLVALLTLVMAVPALQAQSGIEITEPVEVTELFGDVTIEGTAAVPGMAYYYLEVHPLTEALNLDEDTPWIPITTAIQQPVVNGELAVADTNRIDDGLYALRLTVNTADGQSFHADVGPLRVSNERFADLLGTSDEGEAVQLPLVPGDAPVGGVTATSFQPGRVSPNVRYCDIVDNARCPIIDHLDRNETAQVVARSATSGGWYKIRLNSGHEGWISESVIIVSGDVSTLPSEAPPTPRPPAPVQPSVTQMPLQPGEAPVYVTTGAIPNSIAIEGGQARCDETFNVQVNIANTGNSVSTGGQVSVQDVNLGTGEITASGYGTFPNLNPGANYVVVIPLRTAVYYNETHELRARAAGRDVRLQYNLQQGNCNRSSSNNNNNNNASAPATSLSCTLSSSTGSFEAYGSPGGEVATVIQGSTITGEEKTNSQGLTWYRVTYLETQVWIPVVGYISTSGSC